MLGKWISICGSSNAAALRASGVPSSSTSAISRRVLSSSGCRGIPSAPGLRAAAIEPLLLVLDFGETSESMSMGSLTTSSATLGVESSPSEKADSSCGVDAGEASTAPIGCSRSGGVKATGVTSSSYCGTYSTTRLAQILCFRGMRSLQLGTTLGGTRYGTSSRGSQMNMYPLSMTVFPIDCAGGRSFKM